MSDRRIRGRVVDVAPATGMPDGYAEVTVALPGGTLEKVVLSPAQIAVLLGDTDAVQADDDDDDFS